ncbi:PilW family protein [Pyxidicoccus xibeiensis]|uniref:PilW family protein n=1 Tax=Pyxidicoccus xibeiensis TaxID=2906759 RepID=UPI0020A7D42D|nr:prepilin-type N-terminal cleavage/methylation domain-containing protein [Pyxidicoccus xibeiensis]MCP3136541.1 prepilin-type N-terminal cleavage/methylation domain-containing protein [Pyxidicoccus xibeiensis]
MSRPSLHRGFTLLEVTLSSVIGSIVLLAAMGVGLQLQRRALFEEQTMMAQSTGRAVKDALTVDLQLAGLGMGNAPIAFANNDTRFALQVWTEPDLTAGLPPAFAPDATFALPPSGSPYENFRSDVVQLYWGDTRNMIVMDACNGKTVIRQGNSFTFCTGPNPPTAMNPPGGQRTPAIIVNPAGNVACHLQITNVNANSETLNANPGSAIGNTGNPPCGDPDDGIWEDTGWLTMRTEGSAWRVNWARGAPTLEHLPAGAATWVAVSRDVERLKVRQAVVDLANPAAGLRWYPEASAGRPALDRCTRATCTADSGPPGNAASSDNELRRMLQQRVRELEVTLVIRSRRADVTAVTPGVPMRVDEEGFPEDGFKRRTLTFRVTPRNFAAGGLQPQAGAGT